MKNEENFYFASSDIAGIHFKIYSSHKGIVKILLNKKEGTLKGSNQTNLHTDDPFMFNVFSELEEYFGLTRKSFDVPLDIRGTDFQKNVWNELLNIPFGKTVSYKFIAKKLGDENAIRAVGRANGANPIPVIIPCHRVINGDGSLGGYSGGLQIKEKLLKLEGSLPPGLFE